MFGVRATLRDCREGPLGPAEDRAEEGEGERERGRSRGGERVRE